VYCWRGWLATGEMTELAAIAAVAVMKVLRSIV
jgi:hypothetical protein